MPDVKLVDLGRLIGRVFLLRQGRMSLRLAAENEEALAEGGWPPSMTVEVRQIWRELADSLDEEDDLLPGAGMRSLEEAALIAESRSLVSHLHEALRQLFLFGEESGLNLQAFSFQDYPLQTSGGLMRYFEDIRPKVGRLEPSLKRWFREVSAGELLDRALEQLGALEPDAVPSDEDPQLESMRVLELKGHLLILLQELERTARDVFPEGDPVLAGLFLDQLHSTGNLTGQDNQDPGNHPHPLV